MAFIDFYANYFLIYTLDKLFYNSYVNLFAK